MEVKTWIEQLITIINKYRYAVLILIIGIALMLIPVNQQNTPLETVPAIQSATVDPETKLASLLSCIKDVGRVEVLLSYASGEQTIYQSDADAGGERTDTVIVTDSDRNQAGLITQIKPPVFLGAIVVCQGAGNPTVRLAVVDAVSKFTGLGAHQISVLEMK